MKRKMTIALAALLASGIAVAQQTTATSGGNASGTGGSASYTVGQVAYTTASGTGGTAQQGMQQAYRVETISGADVRGIELACRAYPNPTVENLTLEVENPTEKALQATLFDLDGRKLTNLRIVESLTIIPMETLNPGTYVLKVADKGREVKTFKVIKN